MACPDGAQARASDRFQGLDRQDESRCVAGRAPQGRSRIIRKVRKRSEGLIVDCIPGCNAGHREDPVHELTRGEIKALHRAYADSARRSADAGFEWLELHFAHGHLGSSFFSPLANHRTDKHGGTLRNRARFLLEAIDAVRKVWPEKYPLTMRLGSDDLHPDGVKFDEAIQAVGWMKDHGLDFADLSIGFSTDEMNPAPFGKMAFMVEHCARLRREVDIPVAGSWNLGQPAVTDRITRDELIDLACIGRPALANPHWPVWAARAGARGPLLAGAGRLGLVATQLPRA